jgi:ABC-type lipoprotein release transport system permease subunit
MGHGRLSPSPLFLRALRLLVRFRWHALGLALLVAICVGVIGGRTRAHAILVETRQDVYDRLRLPDLEIRCMPTPAENLLAAAAGDDVLEAEARLLFRGELLGVGRGPLPAVIRLLPSEAPPRLAALEILEGRYPEPDEPAVVIDRSLRDVNHVAIGQEVEVVVGEVRKKLPVVGVSLSPELLTQPTHPEYVTPLRGTLAAIGVSEAAARDVENSDRATSLLLMLAPDADPAAVIARVSAHPGVRFQEALGRDEQPSTVISNLIISAAETFGLPVTIALSAVGALLLILTLTRIVRRQRRQVGILSTLGYRRPVIAASFLFLPAAIALVGTLLGGGAARLYGDVLARGLTRAAAYPELVDPRPTGTVFWAGTAALVLAVLTTYLAATSIVRPMPATTLRPLLLTGGISGHPITLSLAAWFARVFRIPLTVRLGFSQLVRRGWETPAAAIGLAAAFAVVMAFMIVHVTQRREAMAIAGRWSRDATVHFHDPAGPDGLAAVAAATNGVPEPFVSRIVLVTKDEQIFSRKLLGAPIDGLLARLPVAEGRAPTDPWANEAVIDYWIAMKDGIAVGDEVLLSPEPDSPEGAKVTIVGLIEGASFGRIVVPLMLAQNLYSLPGLATGAHVTSALSGDELEDTLWQVPGVVAVFDTHHITTEMRETWEARQTDTRVAVISGALLALIFLSILAALDATERTREFAILYGLGWRDGAVFRMMAAEVFIRGLLVVGIAAILGPLLARWVLDRLMVANGYLVHVYEPLWLFALVLGPVLVVTPLAALPAWSKARRLAPARIKGLHRQG